MARPKVVIVGAGMGGLAAAIDLARQGVDTVLFDKEAAPGGKMRRLTVGRRAIAAGPTVFTMRWIFEQLFADAGATLGDHLDLVPTEILARHAWRSGGRLDLFADRDRSAAAIGDFAGAGAARGYLAFCARAAEIYHTLEGPFITASKPSPVELVRRTGARNLPALLRGSAFRGLWSALGDHFPDPRLRQLFGRYATYVGASPWLAPATLMLIAHVEQEGVWLVRGGIHKVAVAMRAVAQGLGTRFHFHTAMADLLVEGGKVSGVRLSDGEEVRADAVLFNGDVAALSDPLRPVPACPPNQRSLSAVTWCLTARSAGFALEHHNVFFAEDYAAEFDAIFRRRTIAEAPTVYLCAQDRGAAAEWDGQGPERFLALINAPADGDRRPLSEAELDELGRRAFGLMADCGLELQRHEASVTAPADFHRLFPATGGALYGRANHGAMASFARAGSRGARPGLYLAGGSVHPGAGVPMATMSGRLAAAQIILDLARRP
jgi:1-hydroxycarotenoid 3,4-desaturase